MPLVASSSQARRDANQLAMSLRIGCEHDIVLYVPLCPGTKIDANIAVNNAKEPRGCFYRTSDDDVVRCTRMANTVSQ